MGESVYTIDYLFCNTQTAGQLQSSSSWITMKMIRWTGHAPWEFECPFPGSLPSTFLNAAVYTMSESCYTIDYLFCNTQTAGQLQSQNVVIKVRFYLTESVYKVVFQRQFPHKSVNLFFILVIIKEKLTDLWGN